MNVDSRNFGMKLKAGCEQGESKMDHFSSKH